MIEIQGRNRSASVSADFEAVRAYLQENPCWGAEVIQDAGEYGWRVSAAHKYSKGPFGARLVDEGPDQFIAWGISGKKSCLAYRIEREDEWQIRITPLAYLERTRKITIAVSLALVLIVPVLLSPLLWWMYQAQTLRASRVYLPTFGRYLEQK